MSKLSIIGIFLLALIGYLLVSRNYDRIALSGTTTTEIHPVRHFTKLKLEGVFRTVISQDGGPESVKIVADKNLQKTVTLEADGETLIIGTRTNSRLAEPSRVIVYVNVKELSELSNSAVGPVESNGVLKSSSLDLKTDAVGKTRLDIRTEHLTADLNSVGAIELSGQATTAEISNNSVGKLSAYKLNTEVLDLKNDAVGAAEINASKELTIDHRGVGAVHYKGGAKLKSLNDDGVGKVSKADD